MSKSAHTNGSLRPPLKWAGGKRWLVPKLAKLWSGHQQRRLVEPFCGGLAVSLGLNPGHALLNDINPHPVNFYRQLQRGLEIKIAMQNDRELFYRHREEFNRLIDSRRHNTKKAASLFYYLNRTGYNGLCRLNRSGLFNVPFGRYRRIQYRRDFTEYKSTLSEWEFCYGDFEDIPLEATDFVYADPPYDVEFRQYSANGFEWESQVRLAQWLSRHQGPVVLSNQATDRVKKLYRQLGFQLRYTDAPRLISCNGDRTPAKEVIATRNL